MNDQMNRNNYGAVTWGGSSVPLPPPPDDPMKFNNMNHPRQQQQQQPPFMSLAAAKPGRNNNWKGKKGKKGPGLGPGSIGGGIGGGGGGYKPPTLHELQSQNRVKARRFYKKKFNNRFAPFAPRNTSSFIIRAKKSGGIASLVSPCPVTPAVLPTPRFSPSREVLVDMAKEEWGVDGYGSMNGLIRLRSPGQEGEGREEEEEEEGGGSSESDVEEHVEVERRLDHDLSRFEMIYPNFADEHGHLLENQMDDQDAHVAQLEEENLTLKERLFLMERELVDLKMRLQCLETESRTKKKENKDGTLENEGGRRSSVKEEHNGNNEDNDNDNDEIMAMENELDCEEGNGENDKDEHVEENLELENESVGEKQENNDDEASDNEGGGDICSEKSFCDGD